MKAAVQKVLSAVPQGHHVNYQLQRRTGGLPISDRRLASSVELGAAHVAALEGTLPVPVADAQFFEFGAGWDLHMPLVLRALGVHDQVVVDIRRLLRPELVTDVARRLHDLEDPPPGWDPAPPPRGEDATTVLPWLRSAGVDYRAPADARATGLPSGSIHAVTSTNTLEHIPPDGILQICREVVRILDPHGAASFQVDYSDHYSHFDPTISPWNFLGISERRWRWVNSGLHHQNRLRHPAYRELLQEAGFTILDEQLLRAEDPDEAVRTVRSLPPVAPFDALDPEDLAILGACFLLAPGGS